MHKIVVLDGHAVNPGDLSWEWLGRYGAYQVHERTPKERIRAHIGDADLVLTNKTVLTGEILRDCPGLDCVGLLSTGQNSVDAQAARELHIAVSYVPAYSTHAVAQLTFALLLELCHHVGLHAQGVQQGDWVRSPDFCYWLTPQTELWGKTMGIVGMGSIGQAVGQIAVALGMQVLYTSPSPKQPSFPARPLPLEALLEQSDVVTLHCPLTEQTAGLMNARRLAQMKPGAVLLNTARGPLVEEQAVAAALGSGRLGGCGAA
ncbi:MAG: D-2-hydroxyacid dehydrogenase, partial [Oscillospiraceae bacterium]|nr:D-2-hydroxyacid dehydrogenase [Oscillospiraceae bacterium]